MKRHILLAVVALTVCLAAAGVQEARGATTYYVNPGESIQAALNSVSAGDTVIIRDGTHNLPGELDTSASGTVSQRITVKAENPGQAVLTRSGGTFRIDLPYYTVEGLIFDGQYGWGDTIRLRDTGNYLHFRNNVVRNGAQDGIDMTHQSNVLIEDSVIHDMLGWSGGGRVDAHGIVTYGVQNLTIRNTEIYYVSGDALQTQDYIWQNVLVERCTFWNGDLPSARAGFPAGVNPGENAIDTKEDNGVVRATMTVRDSVFYGWDGSYMSGSGAAMNIKELVDVVMDGNTFYDNNWAMRLRGRPNDGGAHCTVTNNVFYDNSGRCIRYEDDIQELKIFNNTFGPNTGPFFHSPDYPDETDNNYNNLYWGSKPNEGGDASNRVATAADFVDSAGRDFHLVETSGAIDAGDDLSAAGVTADRWGVPRPQDVGFDVGAFEYVLFGDADLDGSVDLDDMIIIAQNWGKFPAEWTDGDFDHNWTVDGDDLEVLARQWGAIAAAMTAAVPEPSALVLMALGAAVLARRRRKA